MEWCTNLEGTAKTVDAVISLLGGKSAEGELDGVVLLGNEVVVSVKKSCVNNPFGSGYLVRTKQFLSPMSLQSASPLSEFMSSSNPLRSAGNSKAYLRPNFRYPAALTYHFDTGCIDRATHGIWNTLLMAASMFAKRKLNDTVSRCGARRCGRELESGQQKKVWCGWMEKGPALGPFRRKRDPTEYPVTWGFHGGTWDFPGPSQSQPKEPGRSSSITAARTTASSWRSSHSLRTPFRSQIPCPRLLFNH